MSGLVLSLHAAATVFMTGLIWFVQVVHYPLMARVPGAALAEYERGHMARTTPLVASAMGLELLTAAWLVLAPPPGLGERGRALAWLGAGLLGIIWGSTWGVQVPLHDRIAKGGGAAVVRRLVLTNWARTIAWTVRSAAALAMLWLAAGAAGGTR